MTYLERAEAIFERFVGYQIKLNTYTKTFRYDEQYGVLIRNDLINEIVQIRAKASVWEFESVFGDTEWVDINLSEIVTHVGNGSMYITLPPTMFGTTYSDVEVTYIAGHSDVPEDIIGAIIEIERLLTVGTITEWNCILPVSVLDVINKYRKEVID